MIANFVYSYVTPPRARLNDLGLLQSMKLLFGPHQDCIRRRHEVIVLVQMNMLDQCLHDNSIAPLVCAYSSSLFTSSHYLGSTKSLAMMLRSYQHARMRTSL